MAPLALATETLRFEPTATLLAAFAWSVLMLSIAAIALLLLMIRHGEVSRIAALIYLVPPLTALEAYVLFGESLGAVQSSAWRRRPRSGVCELAASTRR